ncbi:agmatinase [Emcibacter sp.]|uniref:agmatinase n=1 Tax=Emcibacter sp. TaxID=1979954 RepID=UPI002AA7D018|nr:agmatinase [Emcibacter sp.]
MTGTKLTPQDYRETAYAGILSFLRFPFSRDLAGADMAVLGVPYDLGTTNRSGARSGPRAIREQSSLVGEFEWGVWPWDYHLNDRHTVVDYGDVCDFTAYPERMTAELERMASEIISQDTALLSLGGDHFISLALLRAHVKKYGPLALIHFDAHTDTWVSEDYNHGTMFYHAIQEGLIDVEHSIQLGIRTPNPDTFGLQIVDAIALDNMTNKEVAATICNRVQDRKAYVSFDIDFLDPAFAPGTGTPVPGGASVMQGREILRGLKELNVVGGDLVEVAPSYDPIGSVTALAGATLACDILYLISEALTRGRG